MIWTLEKPDLPGWYWMKEENERTTIVEVFTRPGHSYLAIEDMPTGMGKRQFRAVAKIAAEWAGPIPPPNAELTGRGAPDSQAEQPRRPPRSD